MGYSPDPMLAGLAAYRNTRKPRAYRATIGVIADTPKIETWRENQNGSRYYQGVLDRATELGYKIDEFTLGNSKLSPKDLGKILEARNIRGLIITPRRFSRGHLRFDFDSFSAITIGHSLTYPRLHRVVPNFMRDTILVMRRLKQMGYRRIGFTVVKKLDERADHGWLGGYSVESERFAHNNRIPAFCPADLDWSSTNFNSWIKKNRPEVVISPNPFVWTWLKEANSKASEQIGFVHLNHPNDSGALTGMYESGKMIGSTTIDTLVGMLQTNETGIPELPKIIQIESSWIEGKSLFPRSTK
jgi:LacI family transcriptional regulator